MDGVASYLRGPNQAAQFFQMPRKAPLAMPVQDLFRIPALRRARLPDSAQPWRVAALGGAAVLTAALLATLGWWLGRDRLTLPETALVAMVGIVGVWISLAATTALVGLWPAKRPARPRPGEPLDVALLIPVYHEDPQAVMARALAMLRDLAAQETPHHFSLYVLSDTRGDTRAESEAFATLMCLAPQGMPVFYRWREQNTDRKSGNLAEWVRGWGKRHDAMIVLDADSLMGARSLLALADDMSSDPHVGLIQTAPQLIGATTLFARMQAFAGAAYGPLLGRGLARWSGNGANFWGHNAIIRVAAFAEAAGLPKLSRRNGKGTPQLIWSHDFVEAALLRRAGWSVRLRPDLTESFEETPPSLIDHVLRDRRWCQGNLQHLRLLGTAGLPPLSRLHLLHGAASYLVSPGWLVLLIGWTALCFATPGATREPMGGWPVLAATITLLLVPKALALIEVLSTRRRSWSFGGRLRVLASAGLELLLSVLFAPILMVQQTKTILSICAGTTIGWSPQNRDGGQYSWATLWAFHRIETVLGLTLLALIAGSLLPLWLIPVAVSLSAAVPLSHLSAQTTGRAVLSTPQDRGRAPVQRRVQEAQTVFALHAEARADTGLDVRAISPLRRAEMAQARLMGLAAE